MAFPFLAFFGAIQAGAAIVSGVTQARAGARQADILKQQAEIQREQGRLARTALFERAENIRTQGEAFVGGQRAGFARAGVSLGEGSPLAVMREAQKSIREDISRTRAAGEQAFRTGQIQAGLTGQRAGATRRFGLESGIATGIQGGLSFLGGIYSDRNIFKDLWGSQGARIPSWQSTLSGPSVFMDGV